MVNTYPDRLVRCAKCERLFAKQGLQQHLLQSPNCQNNVAPPQLLAPATPHLEGEIREAIIKGLPAFDKINTEDLLTSRITTKMALSTNQGILSSARPVLNTIESILRASLFTGDSTTAERTVKCFVALLVSLSAVPTSKAELEDDISVKFHSKGSTDRTAKAAIAKFRCGLGYEHFQQLLTLAQKARKTNSDKPRDETNIQAMITAISQGDLSKGLRIASSNGLADANNDTVNNIQDNYYPDPDEKESACFAGLCAQARSKLGKEEAADPLAVPFDVEDVVDALKSIHSDTAPDASGLHPGHLKLICDLGYSSLLFLICKFSFLGKLPKPIHLLLCGGTVIPLVKDPDAGTVRPIVVTYLIPKIIDTCIIRKTLPKHAPLTNPHQFGIGVKNSTEKVSNLIRAAIYKNPDHVIAQLDFKNAYGTINRSAVLRALMKINDSSLIRAFLNRYDHQINLHMNMADKTRRRITVRTGLLQGDTLAPFFFSLAIHPTLQRINHSLARDCSFFGAYLDDVIPVGPAPTIKALMVSLPGELAKDNLGIELKTEKSSVYSPLGQIKVDASWPACKFIKAEEGTKILGVPFGAPAWIKNCVMKEVADLAPIFLHVTKLPLQHALHLLRSCLVQKFNFILRHVPPDLTRQAATHLSDLTWTTLKTLLNIPQNPSVPMNLDRARQIAELPLRFGGLGLTNPTRTCFSAFLAGISDTFSENMDSHKELTQWMYDNILNAPFNANSPLSNFMDTRYFWTNVRTSFARVAVHLQTVEKFPNHKHINQDEKNTMYPTEAAHLHAAMSHLQNRLTILEHSIRLHNITKDLDVNKQAALVSASSQAAPAFLQAIPSSPALFLPSSKLEVAIRDRLFLSPFNDPIPNCCHPGCTARRIDHEDADDIARELRRDPHATGECARHAAVVRQIDLMLKAVNIPTSLEPIVQVSPQLRGDIAENVTAHNGVTTIYDVSIIDPTGKHIVNKAAKEEGAAATHARNRKIAKYNPVVTKHGMRFFPLIFESSGHIDKSVFDLIEALERRAQLIPDSVPEHTTWAAPNFRQYWLQRISIALQIGTADMSTRSLERRYRSIWGREAALAPWG